MPLYKQYYNKGSRYPKYRRAPRNMFYRRGGNKALKLAKKAISMMNVEFKFHDVQENTQILNVTPNILQITNIPQGDTDTSRDGNQVKLVRLYVRYTLTLQAAVTTVFVRIIIVKDKQTNGAIYTASDLLTDVTGGDAIVSPFNPDNQFRFAILYDKVHALSNAAKRNAQGNINRQLQLKLRFDASTPSIADLTSNSLSIVQFSDIVTDPPTITLFSRVYYVDN